LKDKHTFANPFRIISPKLDSEAIKLEGLHDKPASSTFTLEEGLLVMASKLIEMTRLIHEGFKSDSTVRLDACEKLAEDVAEQEKLLVTNLACAVSVPSELCKAFIIFPSYVERVSALLKDLLHASETRNKEGLNFSDKANEEVDEMFRLLREMLTDFRDTLRAPNKFLLDHVVTQADTIDQLCQDWALAHVERLLQGICAPRSSSVYLSMLESTQSLCRHIKGMAQKLRELTDASVAQS
jgi:Na+/phosphate symporter